MLILFKTIRKLYIYEIKMYCLVVHEYWMQEFCGLSSYIDNENLVITNLKISLSS